MDKVSELIANYYLVKPDSNDEEYGKTEAVLELEDLPDERILPFFLDRVADENEYDLARIEILKIFEVRENQPIEYQLIAKAIRTILQTADDELVRQWAARIADSYIEDNDLFLSILEIVVNPEEDINVRHGALSAIERKGIDIRSTETLEILEAKSEDEVSLKSATQRLLRKWKAEGIL